MSGAPDDKRSLAWDASWHLVGNGPHDIFQALISARMVENTLVRVRSQENSGTPRLFTSSRQSLHSEHPTCPWMSLHVGAIRSCKVSDKSNRRGLHLQLCLLATFPVLSYASGPTLKINAKQCGAGCAKGSGPP